MEKHKKELDKLEGLGWSMNGTIECPCEGTIEIWGSPDGKGQAEYCEEWGLQIKS
ncbi:hypothetical protein D3C87_97630 [compost metagenome]